PSDVFSLGAVLVYASTGEGPFGDGDSAGLVYRAVHGEPELGKGPPTLRPILAACLLSDPEQRPSPAQLLAWIGNVDLAAGSTGAWLPDAVQTMVHRYRTEIGRAVPGTAVLPPEQTPNRQAAKHGVVRFSTSRASALGWSSLTGLGALVGLGMSGPESGWADEIRLLAFIAAIALSVSTARLLTAAGRSFRSLEIGPEGLSVGKDRFVWHFPWHTLSRVRVVGSKFKPWLVIWCNEHYEGKAMNV